MNRKEKILVVAVSVLLIIMGIKSALFDELKPSDASEAELIAKMETIITTDNDGFLYTSGIMMTRVIEVKEEDGVFKGHYRKYVFWLFPMGDEYYSDEE